MAKGGGGDGGAGEGSGIGKQRTGEAGDCDAFAGRCVHRTDRTEAARLKTILTLAAMRIRITLRNKAFLFFSLVMPMAFFFLYCGVLANGEIQKIRYLLGPGITMSLTSKFWGLNPHIVTSPPQGILRSL